MEGMKNYLCERAITDKNACAGCNCDRGFGSKWNNCFNCLFRDPLSHGAGSDVRCRTCHELNMMRVGVVPVTPSGWVWDCGDKRIDAVQNIVFEMHGSPAYEKKKYPKRLLAALLGMREMYPEYF